MIERLERMFAGDRSTVGGMPTFSTVAWLATGMAWATVPFIGRVPWWLLVFVVGVGAWRLRLAWRGRPAPGKGIRHTMSLGVLAVLWLTGNVGFGLDAAAPLFVAFLWIKLLELDAERDVLMAAFLGFFLVTGVLLTGQSLVLTLQALISALVILGGILWYHSPHLGGAGAVDGSTTSAVPLGSASLPARQPLETFRATRSTFGKVLLIVAQALPFAILLFLFTPRPVIQLSINSRNATAGISDKLDPGRFNTNTKNEQVAFRVEFPAGDMPPIDDLYWRGIVLWQTDGNAWSRGPEAVPSSRGLVTRTLPATTASGRSDALSSRTVVHEVTLPANPNPWLYVLDTPTAVVPEGMLLPGLVQEWRDGAMGTTTYRAAGNLSLRPADWSSIARRYAVQLPRTLDPRIRALAAEWREGATSVDEVVERAVGWFTRNRFLYSLDPGEMGANATATFLFDKRVGFCGHYASAFCVLMRAAGIPARVVLGYHGGEINEHGGFLVVRQSQAHAWAEVWSGSDRTGWLRVDLTSVVPVRDPDTGQASATPASQAIGSAARAAARAGRPWYEQAMFQTRVWYEFIESRWDRWAIGYNSELQDELLGWLGLDDLGGWAHTIGLVLGGMIVLLSIAIATWLSPRLREALRRTPEERFYRRLLARCARAGLAKRPAEGPRDHAARVCTAHPAQAAAIRDGIEAWLRVRYGAAEPQDRRLLAAAASAAARLRA